MNKSEDDIFREAQSEALRNKIENKVNNLPEVQKTEVMKVMKERLEEGETQWDLLKKMIDGSMTERFIRVMENMPDKEFFRAYVKILEHFKPKITRVEEGETEKPDMTINIQTVIVNAKGEREIIKIEDIEHEDEKNI